MHGPIQCLASNLQKTLPFEQTLIDYVRYQTDASEHFSYY